MCILKTFWKNLRKIFWKTLEMLRNRAVELLVSDSISSSWSRSSYRDLEQVAISQQMYHDSRAIAKKNENKLTSEQ